MLNWLSDRPLLNLIKNLFLCRAEEALDEDGPGNQNKQPEKF
ncbi:MAG TPA: hypothetical protein PKC25_12430 [Candidatus Rifleibacterium sp.]|jgi:hypothetical protein|nr:hypothetical protein [Candidatus Rifleibacterium sp.]